MQDDRHHVRISGGLPLERAAYLEVEAMMGSLSGDLPIFVDFILVR